VVCAGNFVTYQACDSKSGACVADQFAKGFYVAAVVLGSIAAFFVIGAIGAIIATRFAAS